MLHKRVFYGWIVVTAIVASGFIMTGVNSSFGIFFKSFEETYSLTRASTSSILSVRMVFSAVAAFLAGWAIDRYGPRKVFSVMGLFVGLSLLLTGLTTESWQVYITYGLFMSIGTGAVYVVITSTVLRWFNKKRGMALGITGAGGGLGTAVISPLSASLIGILGWRNTIMLLGGFSWLVMLPSSQLLKREPREIGLLPDGAVLDIQTQDVERKKISQQQDILRQILLTRNFWAVFSIWFLIAFSSFFIITHIVPHAIDIGFSPVESATILSLNGVAMIAGRLFAGIISDRISAKAVATVSSLIQSAAILSLVWARELWMLYLFGLAQGLTFASFGTSVTVLIGQTFNLNNIGRVLGILEVGIFIGGAIGPYLGGLVFDMTGSYSLVFMIMGGMALLQIFIVALIKPMVAPEKNRRFSKET